MEKPTDGQGRNTKLALAMARMHARAGTRSYVQYYINRACEFSYVTKDQLRYINALLSKAKKGKSQ